MDEEKDQIQRLIGDFGRWQALIFFPLGCHFIFGSFQTLVTSFLSLEGDYYCKVEAPKGVFTSLDQWRNFSNPVKNGTFDKCNIYDLDYSLLSQIAMERGADAEEFMPEGAALTTKNCTEFEYDFSDFESSIVTDFDLVCGNNWQVTLGQAIYMLGILIGASVSGIISDKFGRRKTIIFFSTVMTIFSISVAFADSMVTFIVLRMFSAMTSVGFWTTFFVYAMELVGGKWKTFMGIGFEFPWAVAYSVLPGIAYAVRNWRNLQLIISVPPVIFLVFYYFMPESPRWLLSQNRIEEAEAILKRAAEVNKIPWDDTVRLEIKKKTEDSNSATILDLFKTPNLCKNTIFQYFNWFAASFVYYALTFDSGTLIPGNIYVNFAVSGLIEFPAYAVTIFLLYKLGRRGPLAFFFYLLCVSLLLSLAMPNAVGVLAMATIGKFGAVCAFAIIYVHAAEIFPTVLRNSGLGSCSSMARVGSILAPIIGRELARNNRDLTIILFSVVALIAGSLTLFLPETNGKNLPETVEEGEAFGKGETAFDICKKNRRENQSADKSNHDNEVGLENLGYEEK